MGNCSYYKDNYVLKQRVGKIIAETKKRGQNTPSKIRLIICLLFFSFALSSYSQVSMQNRAKTVEQSESGVPFKSRWAFRTNAVDWVLLLPNLTAEFDLFNSPFKHYTLSLGVKGNWNTSQNYVPDIVYNLLDVRSEFRWYHRTSPRSYRRPDSVKVNIFKRLKEDVFTWKRLHPRYWRAYYIGAYVDACNYSLKFGKEGRQGTAYGLGVSGGFGIPLYAYKKNYLDLEFGASVGMVYTEYDVFRRDAESNCYPVIQDKHKDYHLLPYPVISELRVAFVYRFASIKNKYTRVDEAKREARAQRKYLQSLARDSINEMRLKVKQQRELQKDSLIQLKEKEKLQKEALKDSIAQARLLEKQAEKAARDSIRAAAKLQKELEKKSEENGEIMGDTVITLKEQAPSLMQNLVDSLQKDSLPAKIEIVPLDKMPGSIKEKKDSLQTDSISINSALPDSMQVTGFIRKTEQQSILINNRLISASVEIPSSQSPANNGIQAIWTLGLLVGTRRERSRQ